MPLSDHVDSEPHQVPGSTTLTTRCRERTADLDTTYPSTDFSHERDATRLAAVHSPSRTAAQNKRRTQPAMVLHCALPTVPRRDEDVVSSVKTLPTVALSTTRSLRLTHKLTTTESEQNSDTMTRVTADGNGASVEVEGRRHIFDSRTPIFPASGVDPLQDPASTMQRCATSVRKPCSRNF